MEPMLLRMMWMPRLIETDTRYRRQSTVIKPKRSKMRIATWNIRTMYKTGKKENVENEMGRLNVNVLGLSEMRWQELDVLTRTGGSFIYSGGQTAERGG